MSQALPDRGETPIGEAEGDILLRFTNRDIRELQQEFGVQFLGTVYNRLMDQCDWDMADKILSVGMKQHGERIPGASTQHKLFEDVAVAHLFMLIIDALFKSFHGKDFTTYVQEVNDRLEEDMQRRRDADEPDPLLTLTSMASQSFGVGVSEPASTPTSSGASADARSASSSTRPGKSASAKRGRRRS